MINFQHQVLGLLPVNANQTNRLATGNMTFIENMMREKYDHAWR